jgi:hypothetical protein
MQLTGLFAWLGLWTWRQFAQPAAWIVTLVLLLAIVTFVLMSRAASAFWRIAMSPQP